MLNVSNILVFKINYERGTSVHTVTNFFVMFIFPEPRETCALEELNNVNFPSLPKVELKFDKSVEANLKWDPMFSSQSVIAKCWNLRKPFVILDHEKVEAYDAFKDFFKPFPLEFSGKKSIRIHYTCIHYTFSIKFSNVLLFYFKYTFLR